MSEAGTGHFARVNTIHKTVGLKEQHERNAAGITKEFKVSALAARVLAARSFKANKDLEDYLNPTLSKGLPSPSGLYGCGDACDLICEALTAKKGIAICCDFDVDGLSGGSQLHHFLKSAGAESRVFVPDRFEDGYGLNPQMVRSIAEAGFGLMITVDFGTTNVEELSLAKSLGLRTIVIDHHHVDGKGPPADVFVNPKQQKCGFADGILSAAGLSWYMLTAIKSGLKDKFKGLDRLDPRSYLDLACLGTICDMVPLVGANRVIAKRGLELLSCTTRPGLVALKNAVGVKAEATCYDVSFGIGPRINAAGRLVHGDVVIDLLTGSDSSHAQKIAQKLNKLNTERQEIELRCKEEAIRLLERSYGKSGLPPGLAVWDESFHTGVIGLVAQRLSESFYRPAAVMGPDSDGIFKGSVRGIKGVSVVETLGAVREHLLKFGGHDGAGGFSVEKTKIPAFAAAFAAECERRLKECPAAPCAEADTEADLAEITVDTVDELRRFAPFGVGNPSPQVLIRNLKVVEVKELKGMHLKATLSDGKRYVAGMLWRQNSHPALYRGAQITIVCKPDYSNYGGLTELQAVLQAVETV